MKLPTTPALLLAFLFSPAVSAQAGASSHIISKILQKAGAESLERSAMESAEHAAAQALTKLGQEGAETAVQRGGLLFLQAGARHGDAFWELARRAPDAARYLAACSDEALALARKHGPDAVSLEGRLPGLGREAAEMFGSQRLPVLLKAESDETARFVIFAMKADSPATRDALFELWRKRGGSLLDELDKRKMLILAGGLTLGMLEVADGAADAVRDFPHTAPQAVGIIAGKAGDAIIAAATVFSLGLVALVSHRLLRRSAVARSKPPSILVP